MVKRIPRTPDQFDSLADEFFGSGEFTCLHTFGEIQGYWVNPKLGKASCLSHVNVHRFMALIGIKKDDVTLSAKDLGHQG
jgi:hypothetical protein